MGEANDSVFRELIVKLFSNNYINILLSGTQCQGQSKSKKKKAIKREKNAKKTSGCHFCSQNPSLVSMTKKKNLYI